MATEKPRFSITMEKDLLERVDDYRHANRISTQSKALVALVQSGLREPEGRSGAPCSGEALTLALDYDALDSWGRRAVRELADTEAARMADESRWAEEPEWEREERVIPLYLFPAAAGYAAPAFGADYEPLTLGADDPRGAEFAVRIQGDSMEPAIPDGSRVFCNRDPLADGDVGVFSLDGGEVVCKQYHFDPVLNITYLFSLNRARADADVLLPPSGGRSLVCLGRVMLKKRWDPPRL